MADARRSSEAAISDVRLVAALVNAADRGVEALVALAQSALSDDWAMDALRGRGAKAPPTASLWLGHANVTTTGTGDEFIDLLVPASPNPSAISAVDTSDNMAVREGRTPYTGM